MIFIDTQLWIYAQKEPDRTRFKTKMEYDIILKKHHLADVFLQDRISNSTLGMTYHQLAEIFHNLAFQGKPLSLEYCRSFCHALLAAKFIKWYEINKTHMALGLDVSKATKIHIWDYLCVMPMLQELEVIYTCDRHFLEMDYGDFKIPVQNPLSYWETL